MFLGLSAGGRRVAVKVIRPALAADPEFRLRFRREVAAARMVNGLFTALVIDADVDDVAPWLATAYVAGPSLAQAVRYYGPLPVDSVLALAAGLAESLAAIHAVGVVHRDLKPSNVLLAEDGPRVIDFGISLAAEATSLTNAASWSARPGLCPPSRPKVVVSDHPATCSAWARSWPLPPLAKDHSAADLLLRWFTASSTARRISAGCPARSGRWSSVAWPRIPASGPWPPTSS